MTIRHIIGILLLIGAVSCFGMSQKNSVRIQPGYESKSKGWVPMGPERDVSLSSFDRTIRIDGDKLFQSGQLSDGLKIEEVWQRVK